MATTTTSIQTINPSDMIYERASSTLSDPVLAGAQNRVLLSWRKDPTHGDALLMAVGSDQHDNSIYTWIVDGVTLPISGASRVGSIAHPFYFPSIMRVHVSVLVLVSNNNLVAYPNNGLNPTDQIPYEALMIARWE